MTSRSLIIMECPSNLGLKAPRPGREPGVKKLPEWLRLNGLYAALDPESVNSLAPPPYTGEIDPDTGIRNADAIATFARSQAEMLKNIQRTNEFILSIGGDCSILIGMALALKESGRYGLFFLDGHTDYSWPGFSQTGGAAGMDFALVTGVGPDKLTNIGNRKPYFRPEDCRNLGNREYDPDYVAAISNSGIHYRDLRLLREDGVGRCTTEFLDYVERERLDGFWIHLDADVMNDEEMPCVDSPQPDGLWHGEWQEILAPLLRHPKAAGMDFTILDPDLDPGGVYTKPFVKHFSDLLNSSI